MSLQQLITFFFITILNFSCTKDSDLLLDSVLNEQIISIEERNDDEQPDINLKSVSLSPINDAYLQNNTDSFNKSLIRVEEGIRTSYLMFDLSTIKGEIIDTTLEFSIEIDSGDGTIDVYKGLSTNWSEENLSQNSVPDSDIKLGTINKLYELGSREKIPLNSINISSEKTTFILTQSSGNDLAFASKEHPANIGPKLIVQYNAAATSETATDSEEEEEEEKEEQQNEEGDQETEEGNDTSSSDDNTELQYWKELFDEKWDDDYAHALSLANSKNRDQEYYFMSYYIHGLTAIWQATGDNTYLDTALSLIQITINDAENVGNGYLGWPSGVTGEQFPLWDSFYWRHVATLTRIMYESPNLRASGYQAQYDIILDFSEEHIWNRYESDGLGNFYRSRTHIASHWAKIGMELHIITGKEKYKEVFDNISFGTMVNQPSNLREQIYPHPNNSSAYAWDQIWDTPKGSEIQDTSHAGAIVDFWVIAYENGMYWTENDINALIPIIDIVWKESSPEDILINIDGTGGVGASGRLHEFLALGRFSQPLQDRIKNQYIGRHLNFFGSQPLGIGALNAKILSSGSAVYPEN